MLCDHTKCLKHNLWRWPSNLHTLNLACMLVAYIVTSDVIKFCSVVFPRICLMTLYCGFWSWERNLLLRMLVQRSTPLAWHQSLLADQEANDGRFIGWLLRGMWPFYWRKPPNPVSRCFCAVHYKSRLLFLLLHEVLFRFMWILYSRSLFGFSSLHRSIRFPNK